MLIEFTGPFPNGKSAFVRHLLSERLHALPAAFMAAKAWKENALPGFSPARVAAEYCLLKGLSELGNI